MAKKKDDTPAKKPATKKKAKEEVVEAPAPKKKKRAADAPPPTGPGKFRVDGGGHADAAGNRWAKGSIVEGDDLDLKFPNVFTRVDDEEDADEPTVTAEELSPGGKVKTPATDPSVVTEEGLVAMGGGKSAGSEDDGTDATEMFPGAAEAGVTVFQKDDGSFSVRGEDGDEDFADADEVTAHIDGLK